MNFDLFLQTLPYMLKGMASIFAVTFVIVLCIMLLNKLTNIKKDNKDKQ